MSGSLLASALTSSATTANPAPHVAGPRRLDGCVECQQVGLFGNGPDHIENVADIGAALGDLGDRLVGGCMSSTRVWISWGPAQISLGRADMVGHRFRPAPPVPHSPPHLTCRGAHLVHGADHALQLQALIIQAAAHGIGRVSCPWPAGAPVALSACCPCTMALSLPRKALRCLPSLDELLVGVDTHLLGQVALIAGEVGDVAADEERGAVMV